MLPWARMCNIDCPVWEGNHCNHQAWGLFAGSNLAKTINSNDSNETKQQSQRTYKCITSHDGDLARESNCHRRWLCVGQLRFYGLILGARSAFWMVGVVGGSSGDCFKIKIGNGGGPTCRILSGDLRCPSGSVQVTSTIQIKIDCHFWKFVLLSGYGRLRLSQLAGSNHQVQLYILISAFATKGSGDDT